MIQTTIKGEKFKVMFCRDYVTFFCDKDKSFITVDRSITMNDLLNMPYFNVARQKMWVDKYGFEIFMGEQEERREGDKWVEDVPEKKLSECQVKEIKNPKSKKDKVSKYDLF